MKSVEKLLALAFALLAFFASLAGTAGVVCAAGETAAGGALAPAPSPAPFDFRKGLAAAVAEKEASQFAFLDRVIAAGALSEDHRALLKAWSNGEIFKQTTTGAEDDDVATTTATGTTAAAVVLGAATPSGKCPLLSVATGEPLTGTDGKPLLVEPDALEPFDAPPALRRKINAVFTFADLSAADAVARGVAARKIGASRRMEDLPVLDARLAVEQDAAVRRSLLESHALIRLANAANRDGQIVATYELADLNCIGALDALRALAGDTAAPAKVRAAAERAGNAISGYAERVNFVGTLFRGASLGSILLVAALGLAITFGLMGVINMAHGEMLTVGAYTAYVVENIFQDGIRLFGFDIPGLHAGAAGREWYFVIALPASFCAAALAGLAVERLVIRHLYRRALESLLATWGVSLVLQQTFRLVFGANNVQVNSPSWLLGNFTVSDITLGFNRLFVIAFAVLIVAGTWALMSRTRLGLLIRSVTQDRDMAACMGVPTRRVNMLTFAFGSGLAGLAGAFLSQIGNVGPGLGQNFIVDNFMTVVVGGVGSIVGTVVSALSIGVSDQVLQQVLSSPVLGKIMTLLAVILFLQWKPGGLFPTKNRALDD